MNDVEDYCPYEMMKLFCRAIEGKPSPFVHRKSKLHFSSSKRMKEITQWKRDRGLNGMRASWG